MKVAILDMQPIDPPVGGGRLRLLGLYHGLGEEIQATYVGTYDWPGAGPRRHMLSPSLEEIDVPLSAAHFEAAEEAKARAGGKNVIDCLFHLHAHLSPGYVAQARKTAQAAEVVVFSHPWIYPVVRDLLDPEKQLIVYDSQNVEGLLRTQLLDSGSEGPLVAREVVALEKAMCEAADLVLACSQEDRGLFRKLYGVPIEKIRVVPNGVFIESIAPAAAEAKDAAKKRFGIHGKIAAIFIGSAYGPNAEAAKFINAVLAPSVPEVTFIVAGGAGDAISSLGSKGRSRNVIVTGPIDEETKLAWLAAADIGINPMFSGSGTNIKMFDFMAAGLPVVTTPVGARGIKTTRTAFIVCEKNGIALSIKNLAENVRRREELGAVARRETERHYSWERISDQLGTMLLHHFNGKIHRRAQPFFSVIVPTFARPKLLTRLLDLLDVQSERDFEVIVVDQSDEAWFGSDLKFDLDLLYLRTPIRGAVLGRNLGASVARGQVLAFIDDDCEPCQNWLRAARQALSDPEIVGLEGKVVSSHVDDPEWRPVTNEAVAGFGFMTANLFVRASAFAHLNGFDIAFEDPHFREDTDLGWRLEMLGPVPYSTEAWVYHPPHRRNIARESQAARDFFFEKDILLLERHPARYRELFRLENHWQNTEGFWPNFLRGAQKYGFPVPEDILEFMPERRIATQRFHDVITDES